MRYNYKHPHLHRLFNLIPDEYNKFEFHKLLNRYLDCVNNHKVLEVEKSELKMLLYILIEFKKHFKYNNMYIPSKLKFYLNPKIPELTKEYKGTKPTKDNMYIFFTSNARKQSTKNILYIKHLKLY